VSDDAGAEGAGTGAEPTSKHTATPSTGEKGEGTRESDGGEGADRTGRLTTKAGDAFDPFAREAYEYGREVLDPTSFVAGRDAHVTIRTNLVLGGHQPRLRAPGRMREEDLIDIRARYVEPPDYDDLRMSLCTSHVLALTGKPSSGRTTTALHLLDDVTAGRVSRLNPGAAVTDLAEDDVEPGNGYLAQLDGVPQRVSAVDADRLADLLRRRSAYLVLVVADYTDAARELVAYCAPCAPPDPMELIARHVDADIAADSPPDRQQRLLALARSQRLQKALGPQPRTDEAAGLAQLLVAHEDADSAIAEIEAALTGFLDAQIAEWFAVLDGPSHGERAERARRLSALRIALAVFDGLPSNIAMQTAESLMTKMTMPFGSPTVADDSAATTQVYARPRFLTAEDDRSLLASTRLVQERRTVPFRGSAVPADVLHFIDPRTPAAVIRYVWKQRPALRGPLIAWLDELACDKVPAVRVRAAQAAGLLCSVDFAHLFTELIEPAASAAAPRKHKDVTSEEVDEDEALDEGWEPWWQRRRFAALALDHAARDPLVRKAVMRRLKYWGRTEDPALRWTAATAWGYDVGQTDLPVTLDELRVLGTPGETRDLEAIESRSVQQNWYSLLFAAGLSIARLFATGAHDPILHQLDQWIRHPRLSVRKVAVQAVVLMAVMRVSSLGRAEHVDTDDMLLADDSSTDRDRWPVLLALQDRHPEVVGPAADLVLNALRSPWRDVVREVIADWFELAAADAALLEAVESFLPRLVVEEKDQARLRGLVRRQRRLWVDPLPAKIADRLDERLTSVTVVPRSGRVVYL
jgi:hypothetical protein